MIAQTGSFALASSSLISKAGELRKRGLKIRLQEQPFRVLATLVERAGEVVTREELQKKLWPADTLMDFDHGLNKAINKIREALSDSAESPRFVETVLLATATASSQTSKLPTQHPFAARNRQPRLLLRQRLATVWISPASSQ